MSTIPFEIANWTEPEAKPDRGGLKHGVFAFVVLQMGALIVMGLTGLTGPLVLTGTVFPTLLISLFEPFIGLCVMFAVVLYEDLLVVSVKAVTLTKLLAFFTGIGFLIRCQRREHTVFPPEAMSRLAIAFALLCMISSLWAQYPRASFTGSLTPVLLSFCLLMASQLINTLARLRTILMCVALSCLVGSLLMISGAGVTHEFEEMGRASLGEANVNKLSQLIALGIFASTYLVWTARSWFLRVGLMVSTVAMLAALLATKSRTGLGAMILGFVAGGILGLRGSISQRLGMFMLMGVSGIGGYFLITATNVMGGETFSRWGDLERGANIRTYIWKVGFEVWLANPAIGAGYRGFDTSYSDVAYAQNRYKTGLARDAHNTFLKTLCELGPLGLLLLMGMLMVQVIYAFRIRPGPDANLAFALVVALSVNCMTTSMIQVKYFWYTFAIIVAMARTIPLKEEEDQIQIQGGVLEGITPVSPQYYA